MRRPGLKITRGGTYAEKTTLTALLVIALGIVLLIIWWW